VYFSRTGEQYTVGVIDHGNTAIVAEVVALLGAGSMGTAIVFRFLQRELSLASLK